MGIGPLPSPQGRGWTATGAFTSRRGPGEGSLAHLGPTSAIIAPMASRTLRTNSPGSSDTNPFGIRSRPMPRLLK
jgi:hypothetical protein